MKIFITAILFALTAIAEIVGCYLPYLWLREGKSPWLIIPAAASLVAFVWLLTLHPNSAGRVYAAYGGMYVTTALAWLWLVDGVRPERWDYVGVSLCLIGMGVIMFAPRGESRLGTSPTQRTEGVGILTNSATNSSRNSHEFGDQ